MKQSKMPDPAQGQRAHLQCTYPRGAQLGAGLADRAPGAGELLQRVPGSQSLGVWLLGAQWLLSIGCVSAGWQ